MTIEGTIVVILAISVCQPRAKYGTIGASLDFKEIANKRFP